MNRIGSYSVAACVLCLICFAVYFGRQRSMEQVRVAERLRTENWISDTILRLENGESRVFLYSCKNTDVLLQEIAGMPEVSSITFEQTHDLSGVGIAVLKSFGNLEELEFRGERGLNDDNIHLLTKCKSLRSLGIKLGQVTDAGLISLVEIPELETFRHTGHFSESALQQLSERLPNVEILDSGW